jgi:hypothetical protein
MSNKLRRTSSGKVMRRGTTAKLTAAAASVDCADCACTDTGECISVYPDTLCRTKTSDGLTVNHSWTYKVEVTANDIPGGADTSGFDEAFGNANRTYYCDISAIAPASGGPQHAGAFFAGTKTTRSGAPHIKTTGATAYDHLSVLQFQLTDSDVPNQVLGGTHICGSFYLFGAPSNSKWPTATFESGDLGWCRIIKTLDQHVVALANAPNKESIDQNGLYKFTPCPPCAKDYGGRACANVIISGSGRDDPVGDGGGDIPRSDLQGTYCYVGKQLIGGPYAKPAVSGGCVWIWKQQTNPTPDHPLTGHCFVWFDGYEYQAIIGWYGPDATWGEAYKQTFYSKNGTQLEPDTHNNIGGTLRLAVYEDVIEGPDLNDSDCEALITITAHCGCPDDGRLCPENIHVQFVGQGDDAGDFEMPRTGTSSTWDWEATLVQINCTEVGSPWFDPPQVMWLMDLYDRATLTNHYTFVAPIGCPRCPPEGTGWTNLVDELHLAGTLLSVVYE